MATRRWGVIEIDFESEEKLWAHHRGGKVRKTPSWPSRTWANFIVL
jgi:hypothetical protein